MLWQPPIPESYLLASPDELGARITDRRRELGESLVILGHHYQTDEVIRHADFTGDSLRLSQTAAKVARERPVRWVVFCGVHFMAESADMLTPEGVRVILPDLSAGCSMADMAGYEDAVSAWRSMHESLASAGWKGRIVPVTYVNSSAAIKAFVGREGGACCTSSNARRVLRWALDGGAAPRAPDEDVKVLFLPDQHLGRNTAAALGIDVGRESVVYDPRRAGEAGRVGGAGPDALARARVVLWAGHCSVHKLFRPEHVADARAWKDDRSREPVRVLVHPECVKEVVDLADLNGSTEFIISTIRNASPGSRWAVGTEFNLVGRLSREAASRGVSVRVLSECHCLCTTMFRIDQPHLCWVLDNLAGGGAGGPRAGEPRVVNEVRVHPQARELALVALERMLALVEPASVD